MAKSIMLMISYHVFSIFGWDWLDDLGCNIRIFLDYLGLFLGKIWEKTNSEGNNVEYRNIEL